VRILVCGSRNWVDADCVRLHLAMRLYSAAERVVIHGGATGADTLAGLNAPLCGAAVEAFPVDHAVDGPWPSAGPRRNARMLRDGKPTHGLAFGPLYRDLGGKGLATARVTGTGDMVRRMIAANLHVRWIPDPWTHFEDLLSMPVAVGRAVLAA